MCEIENIQKFTLSSAFKLDIASNIFIFEITLPPKQIVHDIVIRDVKWICNPEDEKFFSLRSNIAYNIVAGLNNQNPFPQHWSCPPSNKIEFRIEFNVSLIEHVMAFIKCKPLNFVTVGKINIDLELVKYKWPGISTLCKYHTQLE